MKYMQVKKVIRKKILEKILGTIVLSGLFFLLYKLLIPRITAFGCFDDCFNFMGGYFLLHGDKLYSEIFYNHAPLMAYISMVIQAVTHPQNLYELILRHRQFVLLFGLFAELLLFFRFGKKIIVFALLYELTKWYVFGDRFLAEGLIVYPLVYMLGIIFDKKPTSGDAIIAGICTWFILFMREPYILTALVLYAAVLWKIRRVVWQSVLLFIVISLATILFFNVHEFFYNVWTINLASVAGENARTHIFGLDFYRVFFYPFLILLKNPWSFFGQIEFLITFVFVTISFYFIWKKFFVKILFIWILLACTSLRYYPPGVPYYGAFHVLPWYALLTASTVFLLSYVWRENKKIVASLSLVLIGVVFFILFSKASYTHDRIDQQTEFITNYGNVLQVGNVVAALSTPKNTLFLDGFDDIIYFVAHRYSHYPYSWYTSLMPSYRKYTNARLAMFAKDPPDFYYGSCPKQQNPNYLLPNFIKGEYERLYNLTHPSCLWVKKSVFIKISKEQWKKAAESLYFATPTNI